MVESLVNKGDTKALRAVLTAESYLTGVNDQMLAFIREDVARKADPKKFAKIEALKKAHEAAAKAVAGVRNFLTHDTGPDGLQRRAAAYRGPGLRRVS
jgi:hypothetical protein